MKFSELTIDMFRMLQALEREPVNLATQTSKQGVLVSGSPGRSQAQTFQPHLLHPASGAPQERSWFFRGASQPAWRPGETLICAAELDGSSEGPA